MIKRTLPAFIALAFCGAALAQTPPTTTTATTTTRTMTTAPVLGVPPAGALSEANIKTAIANAGYKEVKDLKFDDGVWKTEARGGNAQWVKLRVGPLNGKVYTDGAPSKLNQDEIKAHLVTAGYQNVHDVEYEHGLWSADATTAGGEDVDLLVDPGDGKVIGQSHD